MVLRRRGTGVNLAHAVSADNKQSLTKGRGQHYPCKEARQKGLLPLAHAECRDAGTARQSPKSS